MSQAAMPQVKACLPQESMLLKLEGLQSKEKQVITNKRNLLFCAAKLAIEARINPGDVRVLIEDNMKIEVVR